MATSIIKRMTIETNEIRLINHNLPYGNFQLKPYLSRKYGKVEGQDNLYTLELKAEFKDEPNNRFPIDLVVSVKGSFEIEGNDEEEIISFLKMQGMQMVFPYLRTMVSNITASALMPPIMLPIIDLREFKDEEAQS